MDNKRKENNKTLNPNWERFEIYSEELGHVGISEVDVFETGIGSHQEQIRHHHDLQIIWTVRSSVEISSVDGHDLAIGNGNPLLEDDESGDEEERQRRAPRHESVRVGGGGGAIPTPTRTRLKREGKREGEGVRVGEEERVDSLFAAIEDLMTIRFASGKTSILTIFLNHSADGFDPQISVHVPQIQ